MSSSNPISMWALVTPSLIWALVTPSMRTLITPFLTWALVIPSPMRTLVTPSLIWALVTPTLMRALVTPFSIWALVTLISYVSSDNSISYIVVEGLHCWKAQCSNNNTKKVIGSTVVKLNDWMAIPKKVISSTTKKAQ